MDDFISEGVVRDCLGHHKLTRALTNLIEAVDLPSNILIYGTWGTGKTSFINKLQAHLRRELSDRYHTVQFNPWAYESSPNLLLLLLKAIHDSMPPGVQTHREVKKLTLACFRAVLDIGVRLTSKVLSAGAVEVKLQDLEKALAAEDMALEQLKDEVETCRTTFRELLEKVVKEQGKRAMLVMLDDLDRCLPDNVIALIEGVKLYLSEQVGIPVIFLWAMDRDIVTEAIGAKYDKVSSFTGRDYLEKIFDFQIPVPRLNLDGIRLLLSDLYDRSKYQEGLTGLLGKDPVQVLSKELDVLPLRNPRTLNRVWSMLTVLAADFEKVMEAAAEDKVKDRNGMPFASRLLLGLIIAYSFREWRFEVLHNQDTWDDFLGRCKDERPDSQEYLRKHHDLCMVLSRNMNRPYEVRMDKDDRRFKLDFLRSNLEDLYQVSAFLQSFAC